jgi:hypothetical protein
MVCSNDQNPFVLCGILGFQPDGLAMSSFHSGNHIPKKIMLDILFVTDGSTSGGFVGRDRTAVAPDFLDVHGRLVRLIGETNICNDYKGHDQGIPIFLC